MGLEFLISPSFPVKSSWAGAQKGPAREPWRLDLGPGPGQD